MADVAAVRAGFGDTPPLTAPQARGARAPTDGPSRGGWGPRLTSLLQTRRVLPSAPARPPPGAAPSGPKAVWERPPGRAGENRGIAVPPPQSPKYPPHDTCAPSHPAVAPGRTRGSSPPPVARAAPCPSPARGLREAEGPGGGGGPGYGGWGAQVRAAPGRRRHHTKDQGLPPPY